MLWLMAAPIDISMAAPGWALFIILHWLKSHAVGCRAQRSHAFLLPFHWRPRSRLECAPVHCARRSRTHIERLLLEYERVEAKAPSIIIVILLAEREGAFALIRL